MIVKIGSTNSTNPPQTYLRTPKTQPAEKVRDTFGQLIQDAERKNVSAQPAFQAGKPREAVGDFSENDLASLLTSEEKQYLEKLFPGNDMTGCLSYDKSLTKEVPSLLGSKVDLSA